MRFVCTSMDTESSSKGPLDDGDNVAAALTLSIAVCPFVMLTVPSWMFTQRRATCKSFSSQYSFGNCNIDIEGLAWTQTRTKNCKLK